ncbi:MAG: flagellar filament capping protein FliD [Bacteroidota bacterium]
MSTVSSTSSSSSSTTTTSTSTDYTDFNTSDLVEAKLSSRYTRLDSLNTEVSDNETKIAAYQDMQDKLQAVTDTLAKLRGDTSSTGKASDVFRDRTTYLSSSNSSTASTYMSASVDEGTEMGSHAITISQVAKTNIVSTTAQSSKTDDLGWSGAITLGTDSGSSASINITATMSLADIADAINNEKSTSGVQASVMKVSDSKYQLILTSTETGRTITAKDTSGSVLSGNLGLIDSSGAVISGMVLQDAQSAKFTVDGVTITRTSNDIDDVLDGVTLHLYSAPSSDTTLTLEVDNDLSAIKTAITDFVTAYNSFRDFVVTNQSTASDGTANSDATLFGDSTLRSVAQSVQTILSSAVDQQSLALLGITFDTDNKLEVDETTLDNMLQDNLDAVQSLFSYTMTSSSGDLGLVRYPSKDMSFTIDVTVDANGALSGASIGGDSSMFTVSNGTIKGVEGTDYEGLTMVYTGTTAKSITVKLSQGIADQLYTAMDAVSNADTGSLADVIKSLQSSNDDLDSRISSLEDSISSYKTSLTTLYANMAAKISTASNTADLLKALLNANSNN